MRGRTKTRSDAASVPIAPFADLAFVLSATFFVLAPFGSEEAIGLNMEAPLTSCEWEHWIHVSAEGHISFGGYLWRRELSDLSEVKDRLEKLHGELPGCAIFIDPDPKAKAGLVIQIQDIAYSAGHSGNVVIATNAHQVLPTNWPFTL
ncbi:MAG: biopolymer transporter ExbD [Hyphomonas sp.]